MKGMLDPEFKEVVLGEVEIRETFKFKDELSSVAHYVRNGKIIRNAKSA
jgi:translation initiation factor IF-2